MLFISDNLSRIFSLNNSNATASSIELFEHSIRYFSYNFSIVMIFHLIHQSTYYIVLNLFVKFLFDYITSVPHLPQKYRAQQPPHPTFIIVLTISLSSIFALSSHSASHTDYCALCRVLSFAPTAPALPPYNLALSFYIPRSDCGLYYCSPLSVPTGIPSLSDFALPCPFRKGLFLLRF